MSKKWILVGAAVIVFIAFLVWLFMASNKPLPGQTFASNCDNMVDFSKLNVPAGTDKCRFHVDDGTLVKYSTNPPSFGPHYPDWITKGFYDEPRPDGNLVHSQEHGYVIIWYDCERKLALNPGWNGLVLTVFAQNMPMTGGSEGSPSAQLSQMPRPFSDGSCDNMKNQIKGLIQDMGGHKMIGVPRVGMSVPVILTAWNRQEQFNSFDSAKIKNFINAYRDNGPEATVEP